MPRWIGTIGVAANMNDYVDQFIGFNSDEQVTSVTIRYGTGQDVSLYHYIDDVYFNTATDVIPEPATLTVFGLGGLAALIRRRRQRWIPVTALREGASRARAPRGILHPRWEPRVSEALLRNGCEGGALQNARSEELVTEKSPRIGRGQTRSWYGGERAPRPPERFRVPGSRGRRGCRAGGPRNPEPATRNRFPRPPTPAAFR